MKTSRNAFTSLLTVMAMTLAVLSGTASPAYGTPDSAKAKGGKANAYGVSEVKTETIQLVSINDFHGNILPSSSNPGIAKIAGVLDEMRELNPNTYFFASGDVFQGTAISNLTYGRSVNDALKAMDLQASALGNHEYDWGTDWINIWSEEGDYPFLASNIVYKANGEPVGYAQPYMIKTYTLSNGRKVDIGFIGIATPETAFKTLPANVADVDFTDPIKATNQWSAYLKNAKKVDAVVALTHLGGYQAKDTGAISGEVYDYAMGVSNVDLIFSAHTHQEIDGKVNGIQILQGYYNGRDLSVGQLEFNNRSSQLVGVEGYYDQIYDRIADLPVNADVAAIVEEYRAALAPILNEVIGTNAQELLHNTSDMNVTAMGQWAAKALATIGDTQIAIINGGGIRAGLDAGPITMGEMYTIFPFDNTLNTLEVTGTQLKALIDHGIDSNKLTSSGFGPGQFYGINVVYDPTAPYESKVVSMALLDGTPIEPDGIYSVSTLDFLVTGGDKYKFTGATNVIDTFIPVRQALVGYIQGLPNQTLTFTYVPNLIPQ